MTDYKDQPARNDHATEAQGAASQPAQLRDATATVQSLTLSDTGTWRVITGGAIHTFRLSDSPKTVEGTLTVGRPFPTRDRVLALESISRCTVGSPGYWETQLPAEDQPSDLLYWTLTRPIQRIEAILRFR